MPGQHVIVLVSALLSLLAVGSFVQLAKRYGWGKAIRRDGPASHYQKAGTATMGGVAFLLTALVVWLLFGGGGFDSVAVVLLTCAAALLGFYDDLVSLRKKRAEAQTAGRTAVQADQTPAATAHERDTFPTPPPRVAVHADPADVAAPAHTSAQASTQAPPHPPKLGAEEEADITTGVLARYRLLVQSVAALAFALYAVRSGQELFGIPFLDLLGFAFIVVGTINAFNLTDGVDGLAGGVAALVLLPFIGVSFVGALVGALLGFLWFNAHPARVFMGGVGSEALGAAVAGTAILAGWVWWLPLIALVPVLEVVSVIFQVAYFRYTKLRHQEGKFLLKKSPLHHHFELSGWSEPQVVVRFWAITAVCVALAWGLQGGFR